MTELEEARAAERIAIDRRLAAERAEREAIGYPEFDTPEWQQHQRKLAKRYSELQRGQTVRMWSVPGIHGSGGPGSGSEGTWKVLGVHGNQVQFGDPDRAMMTVVDFGFAYPFGLGGILKEFDIVE